MSKVFRESDLVPAYGGQKELVYQSHVVDCRTTQTTQGIWCMKNGPWEMLIQAQHKKNFFLSLLGIEEIEDQTHYSCVRSGGIKFSWRIPL